MSFMRASCMGPSSVIEWTVVYMEGRRWMFGVERVKQTKENQKYLKAKHEKLGHIISVDEG